MKISNILEGIRMGASDLKKAAKKEYTIGFEFEISMFPEGQRGWSDDPDGKNAEYAVKYIADRLVNGIDIAEDEMIVGKTNHSMWSVVPDGTPGVDAEIVSPVMSLKKGMIMMEKVLNFISSDSKIMTNVKTGLHINIGTWVGNEAQSVDWLKFMLLLQGKYISKLFGRNNNPYVRDRLLTIKSSLSMEDFSFSDIDLNITNKWTIKDSLKDSIVNLTKLTKHGYIELRSAGNTGYEDRVSDTKTHILRTIRALDAASDPMKFRKEYITALSKLIDLDRASPSLVPTAVFDYFRSKRIHYYGVTAAGIESAITQLLKNKIFYPTESIDDGLTASVYITFMRDIKATGPDSLHQIQSAVRSKMTEIATEKSVDAEVKLDIDNSKFLRMILATNTTQGF
jgi:hypothetical protein